MKFRELAIYFQKIENSSSRLTITHLLAELIDKLHINEIDKALYLMQGRVAPQFASVEFGLGEKIISRAVLSALHLEKRLFDDHYKKIGDLGDTIEHFKKLYSSFEEEDLSISEVYERLLEIAKKSGEKSQEAKISLLSHLFRQLDPLSCRYVIRIPLGVLRLGFSDMTVLDAFSWYLKKDKSLRTQIESAYHVRPDLGLLGKTIKESRDKNLHKIKPAVFTPILMMRAERLSSGAEIIDKIGKCAIEPKYDGFRLQIHYSKNQTRLYSRNLEDVTHMYPDLVEGIEREIRVDEIIFEGEAIGFDPYSGSFLPFQETVQRKRKYNIAEKAKEIPLRLFAFDLLYCNGEDYINIPFHERRKQLLKSIKISGDTFKDTLVVTQEDVVDDPKKIEALFDEAIARGLEGIIAKKLDGVYRAGARASNWIKFKRSYASKITDTVDCLVMGYDAGKGKRTAFGIGAFLAGVYDEKKDVFVTVSKIGTGLTDEEWIQLKKRCTKYKSKTKPALYKVDRTTGVDAWVKPEIIVEIRADEISRSPVHTAGYALRFPRLEHFRDDRKPEDATTLKEIEAMFKSQMSVR
ncbi:MAG: ATP-dependent DNA ligase [Patescibacteria group bacterium]